MTTNRTITKKSSIKKDSKDGLDINQVLLVSQPSKKGKATIGKHETIIQRAETTPFDFEDAPIGTYEVCMHSTKRSKKKGKKKEKLEPTTPEPPTTRDDQSLLRKIFAKPMATSISQGTNPVTVTTPIQSSTVPQPTKTAVEAQQSTSGAPQSTTPPPTKQKTPPSAQKGSSSSAGNVVHVTPSQLTPVNTKADPKLTPLVKVENMSGGYYLKIAARKDNRSDSDDSSSKEALPPCWIRTLKRLL
jgi:hypothetical protein